MIPDDPLSDRPVAELLWLWAWLREARKSAPQRKWRWAPLSASWDRQDVLASFRREATTDEDEIWQAILDREASGRWPKLSGRAAHFLRERISKAMELCAGNLRRRNPSSLAATAIPPPDHATLVKQVLVAHWMATGCQEWLDDHEEEFQERAPDDGDADGW